MVLVLKYILSLSGCGGMADAADSKSAGLTLVRVRVPLSAVSYQVEKDSSNVFQPDFFIRKFISSPSTSHTIAIENKWYSIMKNTKLMSL